MTSEITLHNWRFKPHPGTGPHILFNLAYAILAFTPEIRAQRIPTASPHIAKRLAFYAGKILTLILRLDPTKCGEIFMRAARILLSPRPPTATVPANPTTQTPTHTHKPRTTPTTPLSARGAAKRLANYLAKIEALTAEAGRLIPENIRTLITGARAKLGCNALTRAPVNLAHLLRQIRGAPRASAQSTPPTKPVPPIPIQDE